MMMATTPLKELFNPRWYIQYLIDECGSGDDHDDLDNPLNEDNWFFQTRRKFMKYIVYNGHAITHKLVDKSAVRPPSKANPNYKLVTDDGDSSTPTGSSEGTKSGTPRVSSEGSILIKSPQVPTVFSRSRQDDADSSIVKPMLNLNHHKRIGSRLLQT